MRIVEIVYGAGVMSKRLNWGSYFTHEANTQAPWATRLSEAWGMVGWSGNCGSFPWMHCTVRQTTR